MPSGQIDTFYYIIIDMPVSCFFRMQIIDEVNYG